MDRSLFVCETMMLFLNFDSTVVMKCCVFVLDDCYQFFRGAPRRIETDRGDRKVGERLPKPKRDERTDMSSHKSHDLTPTMCKGILRKQ